MWEFVVRLNSNCCDVADFICKNVKKFANTCGGVATMIEEGNTLAIAMACEDFDKPRFQLYVLDTITEAICTFFKAKFLNENLKIPQSNELHTIALKSALINFDRETDRFLITKSLEIEKNLNLESFFLFKLKSLREKWSELVSIANENGIELASTTTCEGLLKFLVENLEIASGAVLIDCVNNDYKIFDENGNLIECTYPKDASVDGILVSKLITLNPSKITVNCQLEQELQLFLGELFGAKIAFLK
ncbi:MAG: hypothetical protein RR247_01000 [Clostridia bacterium]